MEHAERPEGRCGVEHAERPEGRCGVFFWPCAIDPNSIAHLQGKTSDLSGRRTKIIYCDFFS